jgi:L-ascorbate metabolism protein UlaG (beta-lactamase superfamily)
MKMPGILALIALTGVAIMGIGAATGYLQPSVLGALPGGARLEAISHSPNYVDGAFRNQIDTPMRTTDQPEWAMWAETIFETEGHARPSGVVPSIKTNLKALERAKDLVVWLGHSSYYVQLNGQRILIDPVFSSNASPIPFTNTAFEGASIYSADDMPEIDFLLISHDHYDHFDYPTVLALKHKVRQVIVGLGVGAHFEAWGYDMRTVYEADWNQTFGSAPGLQIFVVPARHFSGRGFTRDQSLWVGFALISPIRRLFFSGDTGYAGHFAEIGRKLGPFDWVTLDSGQYDPRWANVHMNPEQAAQAAQDLRAKVMVPGHVGRFSLAPHAWNDPFKRLTVASRNRGYELMTPKIGEPIYLDGKQQKFPSWWQGD